MTPLVLNSLSSFCIVDMNCLSDEQQVKVFSHYVGCLLLYDFLCWVEAFFPRSIEPYFSALAMIS